MRRYFFWLGWGVLAVLPLIYGIEIYRIQNLPEIEWWKWLVPFGAIVLIFFSRNRDDVLKHHVVD